MKKFLVYSLIALGVLVSTFAITMLGALAIADGPLERETYAYMVGYAFTMIIVGGAIIFGIFRLMFFRKDGSRDENVLDKDGPIDRYLK